MPEPFAREMRTFAGRTSRRCRKCNLRDERSAKKLIACPIAARGGEAPNRLYHPGVARPSSQWTSRRLTVWGSGLLLLSWFIYVHTMMVPGYIDRAGRFKGTDYIYFYVMGSLVLDGRTDALYQPDAHLAEGRRRIDPSLALYAPYSNYG